MDEELHKQWIKSLEDQLNHPGCDVDKIRDAVVRCDSRVPYMVMIATEHLNIVKKHANIADWMGDITGKESAVFLQKANEKLDAISQVTLKFSDTCKCQKE